MTRKTGWEKLLAEFIHARLRVPFKWGEQDCCLFACDAVLEITGEDLAAEFRGKYSDAKGAIEAMEAYAGDGARVAEVAEKVAERFSLKEVEINYASRGDIALLPADERGNLALGIVDMGGTHALGTTDKGLGRVPRKMWQKAWRV